MSDGMLEAEVVNMQPSQLPAGSYRIRLFTGATATAVEAALLQADLVIGAVLVLMLLR